jgi:UDP-N-acetylmuramate dehydrogenase
MGVTSTRQLQWDLPAILRDVPGHKRFLCPLAKYTSFRIGGPADALLHVENVQALKQVQAIVQEHAIPLFVLGGGSNLLIRDGGVRGIVVSLRGVFRTYQVTPCPTPAHPSRARVHAGVGVPFSRLAVELARQNWSGLEFAYGIPGSLGGAMVMNAGTYLGELRQVLTAARMLLSDGKEHELPVEALGLRYRSSSYPTGALLLAATMQVQAGERATIEATMRASYARRQQTQPLCLPNAGSIFKNPPGLAAGRLIEALGLKGKCIGDAEISPVHANFIVNTGRATAADVETLIAFIQERVHQTYGIVLELEVRVVGEER